MEKVNFIESLNIEERPMLRGSEVIKYHSCEPFGLNYVDGEGTMVPERTIKDRIVPIHQINKIDKSVKPDLCDNKPPKIIKTYIAYSKEVQELLEMPFDLMKGEIEDLQKRNERIATASLWKRCKFMLTGNIDSLEESN